MCNGWMSRRRFRGFFDLIPFFLSHSPSLSLCLFRFCAVKALALQMGILVSEKITFTQAPKFTLSWFLFRSPFEYALFGLFVSSFFVSLLLEKTANQHFCRWVSSLAFFFYKFHLFKCYQPSKCITLAAVCERYCLLWPAERQKKYT